MVAPPRSPTLNSFGLIWGSSYLVLLLMQYVTPKTVAHVLYGSLQQINAIAHIQQIDLPGFSLQSTSPNTI